MIQMRGDEQQYQGPERREALRRVSPDRRQEIRFEPLKQDRRQISGRRKEDRNNDIWRNRGL